MEFLSAALNKYTEQHTQEESAVLSNLNRETYANVMMPRMLSGHLQGQVIRMFSYMIQPERILEIGTYTGYSAICWSAGLKPGGKLFTLDINEELEKMVRKFFKEADLESKINPDYALEK